MGVEPENENENELEDDVIYRGSSLVHVGRHRKRKRPLTRRSLDYYRPS